MSFDPSKPADHSPLSSAEMRAQLTALNADTQTRPSNAEMATAIALALAGTSNNSNSVNTMSQTADSTYQQAQMQALFDKIDELILALRR